MCQDKSQTDQYDKIFRENTEVVLPGMIGDCRNSLGK